MNNADNITYTTKAENFNSFDNLYVHFKDAGLHNVDVTSPKIYITKENGDYTLVNGVSLTHVGTGIYAYTCHFTGASGWTPGLYQVKFTGLYGTETLQVNGQIKLGDVTPLQWYVTRVRWRVKDFFRKIANSSILMYQLDDPTIYKYMESEIYGALLDSLSEINACGPRITSFQIESIPVDAFLITGAVIHLLEGQAILEIMNKLQDQDAKLTIDRGGPLASLAAELRRAWMEQIISWKKAYRPTPIGLGSARIPFRVLRPLALITSYQNTFGL